MKRALALVLLIAVVLVLAGACAAGPNTAAKTENDEGKIAGFWHGLWHGLIAPVTFIISLFTDKISMYEIHNNMGWYNFGFIIGVMIIFGGGGSAGGRSSRRRS